MNLSDTACFPDVLMRHAVNTHNLTWMFFVYSSQSFGNSSSPQLLSKQQPYCEAVCLTARIPVTSCEAERIFSSLRRLSTWLRSTMTHERPKSSATFNVHHDYIDEIDLEILVYYVCVVCRMTSFLTEPYEQ